MTLVIPVGFAQIAYQFALEGDPEVMISTIGMDLDGVTGLPAGAAGVADEAFQNAFPAADFYTAWRYLGVRVLIGQDGGPPVVVELPASVDGLQEPGTPPQNCAVLLRKQTGLGGRSGRGRMFLPPFNLAETNVASNGLLDSDYRSDMQAAVNTWMGDFSPVLLHDSATPGSPAPTPITSVVVDQRIATQRRRLR